MNLVDPKFMQRALFLAQRGAGRVAPNPLVGCVIVRGGKIISEGWHQKFGGDHAEIVALKRLTRQKRVRLRGKTFLDFTGVGRGATLYVTLEPCAHFGKTPPCVDAVIRAGFKRVVIAMVDPNPLTAGKSIRKLRRRGISVTLGVCQKEAQYLNRFFIKHVTTGMPYVIAKVATTLDGALTRKRGKRTQISGVKAQVFVQRLRSQVSAIMVGLETVRIDDPLLSVRNAKKPQPLRVILDSKLRTSPRARIFQKSPNRVMFCTRLSQIHPSAQRLLALGAEIVHLGAGPHQKMRLKSVLKTLGMRGINSVLCEGGASVAHSLCRKNLVDEWHFIIAPQVVKASVPRVKLADVLRLNVEFHVTATALGSDVLVTLETASRFLASNS